jgi:hypothetical protein
MVRLLCERLPSVEARVVPLGRLTAEVGSEEAERILDSLRNSTTAETARSRELEREAGERLNGTDVPAEPVSAREREPQRLVERRSGSERRRGVERRQASVAGLAARVIRSVERRESVDRRSGVDRREQQPHSIA